MKLGSIDKYMTKGSSKPRWRYRIYTGKTSSGVKQYASGAGFETEKQATKAMRAHLDKLDAEKSAEKTGPPADDPIKLAEWIEKWLGTYAVEHCQPKTLERYKQLVGYLTSANDGDIARLVNTPVPQLRRPQLRSAFYALLRTEGKRRKHLSARTVRHVAGVISAALSEAVEQELLPSNPMLRLKLPPIEQREARSLTPDQISALREACRGDWTFAFVELALASGARRGELLAFEWPDLDWITGTLTISKSLEQTRAGLRIKRPKNKKTRPCRLGQIALAALRFLRDQQQEHKRVFGADYQDRNLIFAEVNGDYLQPDLVSQTIVRRMRKARINDASLHTLRHSHASNLLSRGVPLPAVSARLGHANVNITAKIYSHALPDDDRRAAETWDTVIAGPVQ